MVSEQVKSPITSFSAAKPTAVRHEEMNRNVRTRTQLPDAGSKGQMRGSTLSLADCEVPVGTRARDSGPSQNSSPLVAILSYFGRIVNSQEPGGVVACKSRRLSQHAFPPRALRRPPHPQLQALPWARRTRGRAIPHARCPCPPDPGVGSRSSACSAWTCWGTPSAPGSVRWPHR